MCNNKYCSIEYQSDKQPCKDCKFNVEPNVELPPEFEEIFGKNNV